MREFFFWALIGYGLCGMLPQLVGVMAHDIASAYKHGSYRASVLVDLAVLVAAVLWLAPEQPKSQPKPTTQPSVVNVYVEK